MLGVNCADCGGSTTHGRKLHHELGSLRQNVRHLLRIQNFHLVKEGTMYSTTPHWLEQRPEGDPDNKCENLHMERGEKVTTLISELITSITAVAQKNFARVVFAFTYLADL